MASQTKVDSAGRRAAERRTESSPPSHPSDTSASGTFAAPGEPLDIGSARVAAPDDGAGNTAEEEEGHPQDERVVAAAGSDDERGGADSELAALRVSSIQELGSRAAGADDDEDVSIDELLISDSTDGDEEEEEEEEATDIHPGLSESLLAESLRPAAVPRLAAEPAEAEALLEEASLDSESDAQPVSEVTAASDTVSVAVEEPLHPVASPAEADPEEVVVNAMADDLSADGEPPLEGAEAAQDASAELEAAPESVPPESEVAMEVELAPESEVIPESVPFDGEVPLEPEGEPALAAELDVEETTAEPPHAAPVQPQSERQTVPETFAAKRRDAPLPSFDIPEGEAASARRVPAPADPRTPVALPALSEDDDDAVTHMGLPVVPEVANDYPAVAVSGFAVADPGVAALQSLDADIARGDSRRATTRVIPRLDPRFIPQRPRSEGPAGPPLGERLLGLARSAWERVSNLVPSTPAEPGWGGESSLGRRRLSWLAENVLPPLSLVLFGSGLGAGVIMLVDNDEPAREQALQSLQDASSASRGPVTLADRARAGDGEALYKITNMSQDERTSSLTLALEAGYQAQRQRELREFVKATVSASTPLPASAVGRMVEYATSPETMLPAFQELTQWSGPVGPDLLYAVWEKAAGGSRAASLAQQLLYAADQRSKASPALQVALDLRAATSCDDYLRVLPAVVRDGDQRSSATLRYLGHSDGCGTDGKQDCYPCLREGTLLEDALKAVELR